MFNSFVIVMVKIIIMFIVTAMAIVMALLNCADVRYSRLFTVM